MEEPTIGIDLGTTYSCVAVIQNEKPLIIDIDNGLKTMASVVSYTKNGRVIGDKAKENVLYDPTSTIYAVKRIIGCRYKDIVKENTLHKYPVEIIDDNDSPRYKVELNGAEYLFSPEEVSATILEKLKESAEKCLKMAITKAVITVPAHFNDSQRQATKDAGRIAGLDVLRIINEPTAAALAYGIHKKYKNQNNACQVLVYDFGGGTFDVSIISIDDGIFEVKSTTGDTRLGGDDIDELLVNYFVQEFNSRYNLKLMNDRRAIRRLRLKCEHLKKNLSDSEKSAIEIDSLHDGIDFFSGISRTIFDQLCIPLIKKTLTYVQDALNDANMSISEIDEVVLVGGTTRIPIVRKMVQRFFNGKKLNLSQNPDEAVAIGAAVQAAILDNNYQDSEILGSLLLMDVISLSLGVETVGGVMDIIIPRNTAIPTEITKEYSTAFDNQKSVRISVFEGERMKVNENCLLGSFSLKGIKPAPRNEPKILITFIINTDGILNVTATETKKNISMSLDIHMDKNRLSNGEIEGLILEAAKLRKEDAKWEEKISACLHLEHYCLELKHMVTETLRASVTNEHKEIVLLKCDEVLKWAKINGEEDKEIYARKKKEVYNVCYSLIKLYL